MTEKLGPTAIYANTVVGLRARKPGILHVALGQIGFEDDEPEMVLRMALPVDTAKTLAAALLEGVAICETSEHEKMASAEKSRNSLGILSVALTGMVQTLVSTMAAAPETAERLDEIERHVLNNVRNIVTEGVPIENEAEALTDAIAMVEQLFKVSRGQGGEMGEPKTGGPEE